MDSTDRDDLAALDFAAGGGAESDDASESDALDFSAAGDRDDSAIEVLGEYAPTEPEVVGSELDALRQDTGDENEEDPLEPFKFTVTNPPETVSVTALIGGRIQQIELSRKVTSMSESELVEEIRIIAHLAEQKALAGQQTYLMENEFLADGMRELGLDGREIVRDVMQNGLGMPSPEQAEAAQAEVFAARYTRDDD